MGAIRTLQATLDWCTGEFFDETAILASAFQFASFTFYINSGSVYGRNRRN